MTRRSGVRANRARPLRAQFGDGQRVGEEEPLRVIDPDALQLIEHGLRLDEFGDGGNAERAANLADGLDHAARTRIC